MFEDITQKHTMEQVLGEKDAEFRIAIQTSSDGFWMANLQGQLLEVNDAYARLSGYTRAELLQMVIPELDSFDDQATVAARMQRIVQNGHERFAVVHRAKDGRRWPAEVVASYSPVRGGRVFCFIKDLTEQQHSAELIWHQANFDRLTELPNRALFFDRLSQECSAARRDGKRVALLFADLDAFKAVNDHFGHNAGDRVLQTVAARWLACVRGTDTIARLGGDEFAIIVGNLDSAQEASAIAGKIVAAVGQPIDLGDANSCSVGVSVGIAIYPDHALEMDSLLQAADKAMYVCKSRGKNAYAFSDRRAAEPSSGADWIAFNEAHLIGVAVIDEQHRQLVRMVNELNRDIAASAHHVAHISERFDELINFTVLHFQTEHRFMVDYQYPDANAHDHEHGQLTRELALIVQKKSQNGDLLVLQRIKDWLLTHIQTADKALGQFLNAQGVR
jgi:diguanylate cyclase (GGDEF)-like protein/hemerythrin-like metal-binding protein/PAS domain S-box-containing protein